MNFAAVNLDVNEVHIFNIWYNIELAYRINRFDKRYIRALCHNSATFAMEYPGEK